MNECARRRRWKQTEEGGFHGEDIIQKRRA